MIKTLLKKHAQKSAIEGFVLVGIVFLLLFAIFPSYTKEFSKAVLFMLQTDELKFLGYFLCLVFILFGLALLKILFRSVQQLFSYNSLSEVAGMKHYGVPEEIIERIEKNIDNKSYLLLFHNPKRHTLLYMDQNEILCISPPHLSGYLQTKDAVWTYYNQNCPKEFGLLYIWGKKRVNSCQIYMTIEEVGRAFQILEHHSDALAQYIDRLRSIRDLNYNKFLKECEKIKNKG